MEFPSKRYTERLSHPDNLASRRDDSGSEIPCSTVAASGQPPLPPVLARHFPVVHVGIAGWPLTEGLVLTLRNSRPWVETLALCRAGVPLSHLTKARRHPDTVLLSAQ